MLGLRLYQLFLSPLKVFLFGATGRCRFDPSCSVYALEAIRSHGALKGSWFALLRLARCHPWGGCGSDPVPARHTSCSSQSAAGKHCLDVPAHSHGLRC